MRDRLIEILNKADERCDECEQCKQCVAFSKDEDCINYLIADTLLANGVIVPPCKVGDIVYSIQECSCENIDGVHTECEFYGYGTDDRICTIPNGAKCPYQYRVVKCYVTDFNLLMFTREWGKTVFLTKELAEKALAERSGE